LILQFADHPGTTGRLVGRPGALYLYRYTDSPVGAYDELSYSPGAYEYLNLNRLTSKAHRITKSYVSCGERGTLAIRRNWGIPAEQAEFTWHASTTGETTVKVTLPSGEHIIELTMRQVLLQNFTINSKSIMSDSMDMGRLAPIVQPLLDGNKVPAPMELEPFSPLLQSAPLLRSYTSIVGTAGLATLVHADTNPELFPPIEDAKVSRYGMVLLDVTLIIKEPTVVLDVIKQSKPKTSRICTYILNWINTIIFRTST
jgi:hypothetical protein